jgi:aldose 1-epimerase
MAFQVRVERRPTTGGWDGTVYILEDAAGANRALVWPAFGFNCCSWQTTRGAKQLDLLYADPQLFNDSKPTRSGIPVLFPFPNRIRDGRFTWGGRTYELPRNDSTSKNAIHGFPCRRPWRVVGQGADASAAWVVGEFQASVDARDVLALWPADYRLRLTYRLTDGRLHMEAEVHNPDRTDLPFGLGFHHYFRTAFAGGDSASCLVHAPARTFWELKESLPSGSRPAVTGVLDLNTPRPYSGLAFDDVLTGLPSEAVDGLCERGSLRDPSAGLEVRLRASPDFRELVVFTPAHREAMCLEPYTCTTDAINLQQQGSDAGLLVLGPGMTWTGVVEMSVG